MENENLELVRHIDKWLIDWKNKEQHKPALIKGIRQSGKTHSIKKFAYTNYEVVIYINFWDEPNLIDVFDEELKIDNIIKELSVKVKIPNLIDYKTVFIYDEVQECPRALLSLKTNIDDHRYDFIASGSYLGLNGYVVNDDTPKPVGCVEEFHMRTLDFEEFLWAKGLGEEQVSFIKKAFNERKALSDSMHKTFSSLFREYLCIGGFPEAVKNYILTNNISSSLQITRKISNELKNDFGRRRGKNNKPIFQPNEVARIRSAYSLIPSFLGKENKRYIISKITGKGAKDGANDALNYLKETGLIMKVHNLEVPSTPLAVNVINNQYKVFTTDIGLLVAMLEDGVTDAILSNKLSMSKGMLYEALVADSLYKRGGSIYYFAKESGLELDFVINIKGDATILEVKAVNGNAKSAKTVLKNEKHYGKTKLVCIKDANISYTNEILTIPHYMTFLLFDWSPIISN